MSGDLKAQVLSAIDIVQLISQTVALKKVGKDFKGLCPFHQEKTPSFKVSPQRQAFYCFGCKASGNAIDFVIKRDRVEFKEALESLAQAAGIEVPRFGSGAVRAGEKQALIDAHSAAATFFENLLNSPQGIAARQYLTTRGFTPESLKQFRVGLAPDAWDALLRGPVGRKFGPQVLATAGLVKARETGGFYDTFRHRIIFPIRNETGQIIAFGGRIVPGSADPAKYLNSPETPLFSKSKTLFGIHLAAQRINQTQSAAVVEGYTDVVMAHQYGASNVVSPLGTALTADHVRMIRRKGADRVVLIFDGDAAGERAATNALNLFITQDVQLAVAEMPDGLDPDEFLLRHGAQGFERLLAGAADALDYAWKQLQRQYVSSETDGDLAGQQRAAREYLDLLGDARSSGTIDPVRWGAVIARVSKLTEIPAEELHRRFGKARKPAHRRPNIPNSQPVAAGGVDHGGAASTAPEAAVDEQETIELPGGQELAERQVMGILLAEPGLWHRVQMVLRPGQMLHPRIRTVAQSFWSHQRDEGEPVLAEFLDLLEPGLKTLAIELVDAADDMNDRLAVLDGALAYLKDSSQKRENHKRLAALRAQKELSEEQQIELLKKMQEIARQPDLRRC
jgi:DNA primase